jgi:hypothetical protein
MITTWANIIKLKKKKKKHCVTLGEFHYEFRTKTLTQGCRVKLDIWVMELD